MEYTAKQKEYIDSVEANAHQSAVRIIGELEAELAEGKHSTLKMLRLEINRLKAEIRDLKIALKADSERIGKIIKFQAELKAKDLIIKLIKNHAAINFDNHLLALIAEIEKDPEDFNKFLKGEW